MKWRRRPHEVEAILFTGDNLEEVEKFIFPYEVTPHALESDVYVIFFNKRIYSSFVKGCMVAKDRDRLTVWDKTKFLSEYEKVSV